MNVTKKRLLSIPVKFYRHLRINETLVLIQAQTPQKEKTKTKGNKK